MHWDGAPWHQSCTPRPRNLSEGSSEGMTSPCTMFPKTGGKGSSHLKFAFSKLHGSFYWLKSPPPTQLRVHRHSTSKPSKIGFSGFYRIGLDMNFPNAVCKLKSGLMVYYWWLFISICQWLRKLHIWGFKTSYFIQLSLWVPSVRESLIYSASWESQGTEGIPSLPFVGKKDTC